MLLVTEQDGARREVAVGATTSCLAPSCSVTSNIVPGTVLLVGRSRG